LKTLPSLKQLEYLVALADEQHFGKASARCNVTPSTLSAGIRELENLLGSLLAERTKRSVLMLPLGLEIASRARSLLRDAEDIMELAASQNEPLTGNMRLGVIPTIGPFLLPRTLSAMHEKFPALRLFLLEDRTDNLLEKLRSGEIDVALIALPYNIEGFTSHVLFEDQFQLACPKKHALASLSQISRTEITGQSLMLLEEGHCLRGHILNAYRLGGQKKLKEFEATSLHTLVQMVAAGLGLTLLPQIAIDANITAGTDIKLIPLADAASRQIGLVWRKSSPRDEEFKLLGNELMLH